VDSVNKLYIPAIKALFTFPQSLGIIGGRPRRSLFFVGYQDDYVIFLDPHTVRPSVKPDQDFSSESFHCNAPQKMSIASIDPSLAIGFFCANEREFNDLCTQLQTLTAVEGDTTLPFSIEQMSPNYEEEFEEELHN